MTTAKLALMAAAAALVFTAGIAEAKGKGSKKVKGETYQVVTYENGKKITTTYKAIGTRKVGMVGRSPYPVAHSKKLADGGEYYTESGTRYFKTTNKLDVEYTGRLND